MRLTNSSGGGNPGGGSGGPTTVADGADQAQGSTNDPATSNTVIGRLKKIVSLFPAALTAAGNLKVAIQEGGSGAKYNANLPNYNDGQATEAQADSRGRQIVTQGTLLYGERPNTDHLAINEYYPTVPFAAGSSGFVFTGIGVLANIFFPVAGSIKIYDTNNVNLIGAATNKLPGDGAITVTANQMISFKWAFGQGCYIVLTTASAVAAGTSGVRPN